MEKIMNIKNLVKTKGKKEILHSVSFEVGRGEVVGFLGANGAGKTTTLKCILGLYHYKGVIEVKGLDIRKDKEKVSRLVSGMIEEPCFYPNMTGMENLKINTMYYGKEYSCNIDNVVSRLNLENYINHKVKTYSLGMKQRLGIALALVNEPEVILLDEPMNGLDPDGIMELRELLIHLAHEEEKTVLVSSHILSEMQMLCDKVIFIKNGSIVGSENVSDNLEEQYMTVMRGE